MVSQIRNTITLVVSFTIDENMIGNTGKKQNTAVTTASGLRANCRFRKYVSMELAARQARNACNIDNMNSPTAYRPLIACPSHITEP